MSGSTGGFKSVKTKNWRLRAQLRTALGAAVVEDLATGLCGHTCAETVAVLANAVGWLERTLHCVSSG